MTHQPTDLIDDTGARIATLEVSPVGDRYEGTAGLDRLPTALRTLFEEFEDVVEGQVFSLLDGIEDRIRATALRVLFADGLSSPVADLQIYPSTGAVSFKTGRALAESPNGPPTTGTTAARLA